MNSNRATEKTKALIKVHADGFLEVFGEPRSLDILCVDVPFIAAKAKYERRCDEWVEATLPWRFRHADLRRLAMHMPTITRPSDIYWREVDMAIVQEATRR